MCGKGFGGVHLALVVLDLHPVAGRRRRDRRSRHLPGGGLGSEGHPGDQPQELRTFSR